MTGGEYSYVGGLVGWNTGTIEDAYATGAVTGGENSAVGGLVGDSNYGGTIEDAYATGAVTGGAGSEVGGLVGDDDGGTYTDDYFDTTSSGTTTGVGGSNIAGVTGLSTTQLEGSLAGFSSTVWSNVGGQTTPYLLNNIGQQSVYVGAETYTSTLISTLPELQAINNDLSGNYALAVDLNATGYTTLTPIGGQTGEFTGTFDGLGNTISDLTIDDTTDTYVGLFGQIGAGGTVENLGLTGENVTGSAQGADVGGLAGSNDGTIENAYATGAVTGGSGYVGGLVGANNGTIEDAYATGTVSGSDGDVGGLVGANGDMIENAYATGTVTGGDVADVGGLVGINGDMIENAYATGAVTGGGDAIVGGLAGFNGGTIKNAYATGAVTGDDIGGLVGYNTSDGTIEDAYATGTVTGGEWSDVGGLVGSNYGGTIEDAYATGAVTGGGRWRCRRAGRVE